MGRWLTVLVSLVPDVQNHTEWFMLLRDQLREDPETDQETNNEQLTTLETDESALDAGDGLPPPETEVNEERQADSDQEDSQGA